MITFDAATVYVVGFGLLTLAGYVYLVYQIINDIVKVIKERKQS